MIVEPCAPETFEDWLKLRHALWPDEGDLRDHSTILFERVQRARDAVIYLAREHGFPPAGFAEATLRRDYVNGCETSPVAFLEGIYVLPEWRKRGAARLLCQAVENWAAGLGCSEFASDAFETNESSHRMHEALGFEETERVVYFRKLLRRR